MDFARGLHHGRPSASLRVSPLLVRIDGIDWIARDSPAGVLVGVIAFLLVSIAGVALFWIHRARVIASTRNAVAFPGERQATAFADAD